MNGDVVTVGKPPDARGDQRGLHGRSAGRVQRDGDGNRLAPGEGARQQGREPRVGQPRAAARPRRHADGALQSDDGNGRAPGRQEGDAHGSEISPAPPPGKPRAADARAMHRGCRREGPCPPARCGADDLSPDLPRGGAEKENGLRPGVGETFRSTSRLKPDRRAPRVRRPAENGPRAAILRSGPIPCCTRPWGLDALDRKGRPP